MREVEERKQRQFLEKEISQLEEAYQKIAERVRGFMKMDIPSGKCTLVDRFIEELCGYSVKDWYDTPNFIMKIIHEDFKEYYSNNFSQMQEGIIPKMLEYKIIRKDGEERWWLQFTIGSYDINQKLISVSIVIIDNTDSKEAFIKYQNLFENALVGMFRTDIKTGQIIEANRQLAKIHGLSSIEELKQIRANEFYASSKKREEFIKTIIKEGSVSDYQIQLRRKDGSVFWSSFSAKAFPKEGYIEGTLIDISEQKKVQQELIEREQELDNIYENTGTLIIIVEEDKTITKVNSQMAKLLGYEKEEVVGKKNWFEFIHEEDCQKMIEYHELRRTSNTPPPPHSYEFRLKKKEGGYIPCYITVRLIPSSKKSVVSIIDISDKKRAEEALIRNNQILQLIAKYAIESSTIEEFCSLSLKGVIDLLNFDSGSIRVFDKERDLLLPITHYGLSENSQKILLYTSPNDQNWGLTTHLGKPLICGDVLEDETYKNTVIGLEGYRSYVSWPFISDMKEYLGSIQLGSYNPKNFVKEDEQLFQMISELFVTAFEKKFHSLL